MASGAERKTRRLVELQRDYGKIGIAGQRVVAAGALMRAYKLATAAQDVVLGEFDLSAQRFEVLSHLFFSDEGTMSLSSLARTTLTHPATMTYTADYLEKAGLIIREPDPLDRRSVRAKITPAGRRIVLTASQALHEIGWGLTSLTEAQAERVAGLLGLVRRSDEATELARPEAEN